MAKQVIVLDQTAAETGYFNMRVVFWVPCSPAYPNTSAASAWSGAVQADIDALKAGTVLEFVQTFKFPTGTPIATMKSTLTSAYTAFAASLPPRAPFFGVFFDSVSGWSA